jgi:hypothetical protein
MRRRATSHASLQLEDAPYHVQCMDVNVHKVPRCSASTTPNRTFVRCVGKVTVSDPFLQPVPEMSLTLAGSSPSGLASPSDVVP